MFLFKTCKPCVYGVSQRGIYPFNFLLHLQSGTNDFFLSFIFIWGYLREFILSLDNDGDLKCIVKDEFLWILQYLFLRA